MVVGPPIFRASSYFTFNIICRLFGSTIYLHPILMNTIKLYTLRLSQSLNKAILAIALLVVFYTIICGYHLFMKQRRQRWLLGQDKQRYDIHNTQHIW